MSARIKNSPWTEKYRPKDFTNIVLESYNRKIFENIIEKNRIPHLLFYGPPGVGKTTTAEALIHTYQTVNNNVARENIIILNASDERGIEIIRNQIYQFVKSKNMFKKGYKFIVLDEVDYMTKTAQQALKNLLQNCDNNVRFCLICNYICKIEESLKNEFICIRFNKLPKDKILKFIDDINVEEKLKLTNEQLELVQEMYEYDLRSMINFLQLHQGESNIDNFLFSKNIWETLHEAFESLDELKVNHILEKIIRTSYNMDIQTCIKKFFNYVIQNKKKYVTYEFLNHVEVIVHNYEMNKYILPYFIQNMIKHYEKIKIENDI